MSPKSRLILLISLLALSTPRATAYTIPAPEPAKPDENMQELQRLSRGVATIAKQANQAIVFVSVFKNLKGNPMGQVDPFEFFFGPGYRGNPDDGGREQAPPPRGGGRGRNNQRPERREGGLGSGFIIDIAKGYIITNNHVVQGADEIQLKLANGQMYEGTIVGRDANTDVAVVQVKNKDYVKSGLGQLALGDSDKTVVGDFVVALGAPFGLEASLSFGVVSAMGRGNLEIAKFGNFIQTDAAINPGNSGGPLIGMTGQVVGMNTAIYSRSGAYNGIGFAVPANLVRTVAEQLIAGGHFKRGYLGVYLQPIDEELSGGLSLPAGFVGGALVKQVAKGSPAEGGGLEAGDVITEVNGVPMKDNNEIINTVGLMRPGAAVKLKVFREGKPRDIHFKLGLHPDDLAENATAKDVGGTDSGAPTKGAVFGMTVSNVSKALQQKYNLETATGALVVGLDQDSAGARAGLRVGDLILKVDNKKCASADDFRRLAKGKSRVLVWLERAGEFYFQAIRTN